MLELDLNGTKTGVELDKTGAELDWNLSRTETRKKLGHTWPEEINLNPPCVHLLENVSITFLYPENVVQC